ncbi:MAG: hypothetical protein ABI388_04315 [Bacteroidia bacterium]
MQTIVINKKVYEVDFKTYVQTVIDKNNIQEKKLKPNQLRFLAYPFITSIFWAKQKGKRITKKNVYMYYNTKHKQFTLTLN